MEIKEETPVVKKSWVPALTQVFLMCLIGYALLLYWKMCMFLKDYAAMPEPMIDALWYILGLIVVNAGFTVGPTVAALLGKKKDTLVQAPKN